MKKLKLINYSLKYKVDSTYCDKDNDTLKIMAIVENRYMILRYILHTGQKCKPFIIEYKDFEKYLEKRGLK